MKANFCVFLLVSLASLITGNLISQPTFGQLDEFTKQLDQRDKEKFLELGEEQFRKDCYKNLNSDNALVGDFMKDMPKDMIKDVCENKISKIKNETATLQQNQTLDSVTGETTYAIHNDYLKRFTVEYPTDWNAYGGKIFKGTREFTISTYDDPKYSVLDTNSLGNIIFDVWKDKEGAKITDNLGQLNIGNEPALSFSYSQGDKEFMVVALMHNNVGYVFEYGSLKQNFDKDFDTMMHFFWHSSIHLIL
jgi:hypothetical protein